MLRLLLGPGAEARDEEQDRFHPLHLASLQSEGGKMPVSVDAPARASRQRAWVGSGTRLFPLRFQAAPGDPLQQFGFKPDSA
jgi:hypothetical protein